MPNHGHRRKPEAGFTLVEMIIVVAIIAVLSAILSLGIRQAQASFALRGAASVVISEIQQARASAIAESVIYAVEFIPGTPGSPVDSGGLAVHRPGLAPANGIVSVVSDGADTRTVIITGRAGNELLSETLELTGTTAKSTGTFDWVLEVEVTTADANRTITVTGASTAVIPPTRTVWGATAVLWPTPPWMSVRTLTAPEWPLTIAVVTEGTTFDTCPTGVGSVESRCVLFGPFGEPVLAVPFGDPGVCADPDQCAVRLENALGKSLLVAVAHGTGRVSVERP